MSRVSALLLTTVVSAVSCHRDPPPRLVTAEFQDERVPDGVARQGESILITLTSPLAADVPLKSVRIQTSPAAPTSWSVEPTPHPRRLRLVIQTSPPELTLAGIYGTDPDASGIGVDLGDGMMWTDLQAQDSLPALQRIVWVDSPRGAGNLTVDEGDWLRLIFDRPVTLAEGVAGAVVSSPADVILSKANDRLDDGERPARFAGGERPDEVLIVLGSRPLLEIGGEFVAESRTVERFLPSAPSGLAVAGTAVLPFARITDFRGGAGSVSEHELDIEFPELFPLPRQHATGGFRERMLHTVTPLGWMALIAGGRRIGGLQEPLNEVFLFDPFRARSGKPPFRPAADRLPALVFEHTATALPGKDGIVGTQDDLVIIIGGENDQESTAKMAAIRLRRSGAVEDVEVIALAEELWVPRSRHAAVAVSSNEILVDGGFRRRTGQLVETAELLRFFEEDGTVRVERRRVFRTLARMHHTLTLLPETTNGDTLVLAYGGFGRDRLRFRYPGVGFGRSVDRSEANTALFPHFHGSVLISPFLINVRRPTRSISNLSYDFSFSLLRRHHAATPLLEAGAHTVPGLSRSTTVLIVGGTSAHPIFGYDADFKLWEMPFLVDFPQGHETADAVLVHFDPEHPAKTRLEILPHPAPDPDQLPERVFFSATSVPGYGVVLAGGESAEKVSEKQRLPSIEVLLGNPVRLNRLAGSLRRPVARHQGYFVEHGDIRSVFLLGGVSDGDRPADQVVEIPLSSEAPR